LVHSPTVRSS